MTKYKRIATFVLCLALVLIIGGELVLSLFSIKVEAATSSYSNVLDDLRKDENFNPEDYPADENDYSLQVIQVAEGENGELFVYIYQPSAAEKDYKAKYINMSLENPSNEELKNELYSLTWLNSNGVLSKYVVNDFTVSDSVERYYNIAAVYRIFDSEVDDVPEAVDNIQCKSFEVGQYWRAYYYNNVLFYEAKRIDVVDIDIQATGSIEYFEGFQLYLDWCDSHYVAFSIENFDVEQIYDADITYTINTYRWSETYAPYNRKDELISSDPHPSEFLSSKDTASNDGDGWLGKKFTWFRITDVDTFKRQVEEETNDTFSQEELEGLSKAQYVFRFAETPKTQIVASDYSMSTGTYSTVDFAGVLRLHFLSENERFNLGCVSNLVGTDSNPELGVNPGDIVLNAFEDGEWWNKIMMVLGIIILLLLLSIFIGPLSAVFGIVWSGVTFLGRCIIKIIFAPIEFIILLFKQDK